MQLSEVTDIINNSKFYCSDKLIRSEHLCYVLQFYRPKRRQERIPDKSSGVIECSLSKLVLDLSTT